MRVGIVGSEAAKFTARTEQAAKDAIREYLKDSTEVVSGGCHLGGIDAWAAEIGKEMRIKVTEFLPATQQWSGGYKERNILIARNSDFVHCITVKKLPDSYKGMTFKLCYHCGTDTHVKSGGCWTMRVAEGYGKKTLLTVIE